MVKTGYIHNISGRDMTIYDALGNSLMTLSSGSWSPKLGREIKYEFTHYTTGSADLGVESVVYHLKEDVWDTGTVVCADNTTGFLQPTTSGSTWYSKWTEINNSSKTIKITKTPCWLHISCTGKSASTSVDRWANDNTSLNIVLASTRWMTSPSNMDKHLYGDGGTGSSCYYQWGVAATIDYVITTPFMFCWYITDNNLTKFDFTKLTATVHYLKT